MTPVCYELRISVPEDRKARLLDLLLFIGEENFVEGALDCDVEFEYGPGHSSRDYYAELARDVPVMLYGEDLAHLEGVRGRIVENLSRFNLQPPDVTQSIAPLADQNWRESWKASFKPIDVDGKLVILPPWEDRAQFSQPHAIVIDPGMAFGTGQHETTRLCLGLLCDYVATRPREAAPWRVFDVGAGSGILAIAARLLGAEEALGCDIDEESVAIAHENAIQNGITQARFTATPLHEIAERDFDLVFANIQMKPLRILMGDIMARLGRHGTLLVSGVLAEEEDEFTSLVAGLGGRVVEVRRDGDWIGCRIVNEH